MNLEGAQKLGYSLALHDAARRIDEYLKSEAVGSERYEAMETCRNLVLMLQLENEVDGR